MARKADARDFLLNTDYEMDKIIYFTEGEIAAMQNKDIPHNLRFKPLVFGVCSFNSDYSDARTLPFQYFTTDNTIAFTLDADGTNVKLGYGNYADNAPKMYYRIYAFEPSNSKAKIGPTFKYAKSFILNTDYNYCKLHSKGIVNGNTTITHNLGYIPQVLVWEEKSSGLISPIEYSILNDPYGVGPQNIKVTDTTIVFTGYNKVHYRIYYDEA